VSIIDTEIVAVSKNYAGITMRYEDREMNGGVARKWWELSPSAKWEKKGSGLGEMESFSNGVGKDDELVGKLKVALWSCGGSLDDVEEAFSLFNSNSLKMFDGFRSNLSSKYITASSLFKKTGWKLMAKAIERADIISESEKHLSKFEWNTGEKPEVSLMVQGTTTEAGWSIAQGGFGVIANATDQGWYGKGIYLTSSLQYAHLYATDKARFQSKLPGFLVCVVVPGNGFPMVERENGRSVEDSYQSHYTIGSRCFLLNLLTPQYSFFLFFSFLFLKIF